MKPITNNYQRLIFLCHNLYLLQCLTFVLILGSNVRISRKFEILKQYQLPQTQKKSMRPTFFATLGTKRLPK